MGNDYSTVPQLLLAFARELNGIQGKDDIYSSRTITVRGTTFSYYFTREELGKILKSSGTVEMSFVDSLYKFEEDNEAYIRAATEGTPQLFYIDWISRKNLKIIIKKGDIKMCGSRR